MSPKKHSSKPERPDGCPLFAHASGRWAKKIGGRFRYFGKWDDLAGALERYRKELQAGPVDAQGMTLGILCGSFLATKKRQRDAGELSVHSFNDYAKAVTLLLKTLGRHRPAGSLQPQDFELLRRRYARTWGPVRVGNEINRIRIIFNFGVNNGLLDRQPVYGDGFRRPSSKVLRKHRAERGPRMFEAKEVRAMLKRARPALKAMLLLAVNGAYSNSDCATLPLSALDLEHGWCRFARQKTAIHRNTPLWPETVAALRAWLKVRPRPKKPEHAALVFLTPTGDSWWRNTNDSPISRETKKLMDRAKVKSGGFYTLRHVFQTIGDETKDFIAVRQLMGHATNDIADVYRERIGDDRLRAVTEHVRRWLFGKKGLS